MDFEDRQLRVSSKDLCGSLVEIHHDGTVELVHLTARLWVPFCGRLHDANSVSLTMMSISYLVNHKHVLLGKEEYNLACLCLAYLNFHCFNYELSKPDIERYISEGFYSFQDYAVVHWVDHLTSSVGEIDTLDPESLLPLKSFIRRFLQTRWTAVPVQTSRAEELVRQFRRFHQHDYFDKLIRVIAQATRLKDSSLNEDISRTEEPYLAAQIELVRLKFERMMVSLSSTSIMHTKYEMFYGSNWYKCPRMDCTYFYRGFPDPAHRDRHKDKHSRPFHCAYFGCHVASVGCRTAKELGKHELDFHSTCRDMKGIFPAQGRSDLYGWPLASLASRGYLEDIERQLEALHNKLPQEEHQALPYATSRGHDLIVRRLLKCNWDHWSPEERLSNILKALHRAVFHSQEATFMLIVTQEGIKFDSETLCDGGFLLTGASNGCEAMVDLLIQRCHSLNYNFQDPKKGTPIIRAAKNGHEGVVRQLLETNKIDMNLTTRDGKSAIRCAAENGYPRIVQTLLQYDDGSQYLTNWLRVAQLYAGARDGNDTVVGQLLGQVNVPPNIYSTEGYTPFLIAVKNGHEAVAKLFLNMAHGDPNAKMKASPSQHLGRPSALGLAARYGHEPVVRLLLAKQGIDLEYRMRFSGLRGSTRTRGGILGKAQDVAKHFGHDAVAAVIQEAGIQVSI